MPVSQADTTKIIPITYPARTAREGANLSLPILPAGHPRLYLTPEYLPELRAKTKHPLLENCWQKIAQATTYSPDGYVSQGTESNTNRQVSDAIEAKALFYLLHQNQQAGRDAINAALHYVKTFRVDRTKPDISRVMGRAIVTGAIVYDWCYPLLSASEKTALISHLETIATQMEIEWPQIEGSSITGHTVEAQVARDMLSLGIAVYDEKPQIYERIAGRILAEFLPARRFFYPAGYHHQGSAYGPYRFYWDMFTTFIFDRMGYPAIYGTNQAQVPYQYIYSRRPDGQLFRDGDDYTELSAPFGKFWNLGQGMNLLAGSYYKDPIVLNEALREREPGQTPDYLFDFLFFDPTMTATATKATLPLTRYFDEPYGAMIARTGWQDGRQSPAVVATMKVQTYNFSNHQHLDAGSFQLYYKGPLAVQSGIYQGTTGSYGGEHFKNYSQRSIAHNTLLIYNPDETFTWHGKPIINDGGQPYPNNAHEPQNMDELLNQGYQTGQVLAHAFGPDSINPDFSYLKGAIQKAYPGKGQTVERSFVFLNLKQQTVPAALIVFDNVVSTNKAFQKRWLLHCVEEPQLTGNQTTITRTGKGYGGKLVNTTLLPTSDNLSLTKVGGPGNEYSVFGRNFPQSVQNQSVNSVDSAVWRIEVSPKVAATDNLFLNVMQVMDAGANPALRPEKIETDQLIGTQLGDRLVLFSKTGRLLDQPFRFTIRGNQSMKVLITDVVTGNWEVRRVHSRKKSLDLLRNAKQPGDAGRRFASLLYFNAEPGEYIIRKTKS